MREGEILGLIGPNGAGKTTLFNVVSKLLAPDDGTLQFAGREITLLPSFQVCRAGIARTFQEVQPFPDMTVLENVLVGDLFGRGRRDDESGPETWDVERILEELELSELRSRRARDLSLVEQRRLEIARALATKPRVLLLDEVLSGLNPGETAAMLEKIRGIKACFNLSLFVIEHNVKAVSALCDRIIVLDYGEMICEGHPDRVMRDPRVAEAYLGKGWEA